MRLANSSAGELALSGNTLQDSASRSGSCEGAKDEHAALKWGLMQGRVIFKLLHS